MNLPSLQRKSFKKRWEEKVQFLPNFTPIFSCAQSDYLVRSTSVRIVRDLCLMKWFQLKISNFAIFLVHSTSFHISKIWKILKFLVGTFHQAWNSYLYLCVYSTSQTKQVNTHSVSKSRFNLNVNLPRDPIRWRDVTRQCPFLGRSKVILLLYLVVCRKNWRLVFG